MIKNKVAVVQFSTEPSLKKNLDKVEAMLSQAVQQQASMILFPEEFLTFNMPPEEKKGYVAPIENHTLIKMLSILSEKYKIAVLAGSLPTKKDNMYDDNKFFNSSILFNSQGQVRAVYHKIHLFDVKTKENAEQSEYQESKLTHAGTEVVVTKTTIGNLGLSICYDLRFPELYRMQVKQGAQILTIPSAFTEETGKVHWEILLRARAIENLSYVLAPAQMGNRYDGRKTYGHAMIISPWGEIMQHGMQEGIICAELDLLAQKNLRKRFPALKHIKFI